MRTETFYSYKYPTSKEAVKARNDRAKELKSQGYTVSRSSLRNQVVKPSWGESHLTNVYYINY